MFNFMDLVTEEEAEPVRRIIEQLDLPQHITVNEFLHEYAAYMNYHTS